MLETTAMGQAELARLLQDLEQGATPDDVGIAPQHLPANMPMAAMVACAIPAYGFSTDDFGKRAFDATTLGNGKAGIFVTAEDMEEEEREKNGGQTAAERVQDLIDAQEEYLQEWMQGSSTIAGLTLSNAEHDELAKRLKNDEQFRTLVITQMMQQNTQFSQKDAEFGINGYQRLVEIGKINKAILPPEEQAKLTAEEQALSHDDRVVAAASASNKVENSFNPSDDYEKQNNQNTAPKAAPPAETKVAVAELGFN